MTISNLDIRSAVFNHSALNRLNNERRHPDFIHRNLTPQSRVLIFSSSLHILVCVNPPSSIALLPPSAVPMLDVDGSDINTDRPLIVLGKTSEDVLHIAVRLPDNFDSSSWLLTLPDSDALEFVSVRSISATIQNQHVAMAAHARALFEFHARHRFCGQCGSPTISEQGGTRRRCSRNHVSVEPKAIGDPGSPSKTERPPCNGMWFPRIDPVVIMLILDSTGDRVLLGRQKKYREGLYSCLAGFMEHGEGVDDAVRREAFEEAGVTVERVKFFGSQAWPFPFSLMLGCIAQVPVHARITVDTHELEQARWFTRTEVEHMVSRARGLARGDKVTGLVVPPVSAIAGQMLAAYVDGDAVTLFTAGECVSHAAL